MKFSQFSESFPPSLIVEISKMITKRRNAGDHIFDQSVGDFDPSIFPMPETFKNGIIEAYRRNLSNYPEPRGNLKLREAICWYMEQRHGISYSRDEILVASGGRPLIYSIFRILVDPDDTVVYSVPSWSNFHYTKIIGAKHNPIMASAENGFLPTVDQISAHLKGARLLCLCSPGNPSGSAFSKDELREITEMVLQENESRGDQRKKLYLMFDQVYGELVCSNAGNVSLGNLSPEEKKYTLIIDSLSKSFASTGVRVGWCCGPVEVLNQMESLITHIGAWAPHPEQDGAGSFLFCLEEINHYLCNIRHKLLERQMVIFQAVKSLKGDGLAVDALEPIGSLYISIKLDLSGKITSKGKILQTESDVLAFLLSEVGLAIVPFTAFGYEPESFWFRVSIGTTDEKDLQRMVFILKESLQGLGSFNN